MIEIFTLPTSSHPIPKYNFNTNFYKMPSYLRRSAIQKAIGIYSSYRSNLKNWNGIGKPPKLQLVHSLMPTLYKDNMYIRTGDDTARIKIFHNNDWVWLDVTLRNQDVKYINRHCALGKELVPTLKKSGKQWYLVFPFEHKTVFTDIQPQYRTVCSVDLGINTNAVCSIMLSDGTVVARKFIDFPTEKDHLYKALNRIKKAQQAGATKTPVIWKHVNDINTDISRKTAKGIVDFAKQHGAGVIVFEFLGFTGKKRGSKKQRLHMWRKKEIQKLVTHKAHRNAIRISRIYAWNTSRLAYDGSGRVSRSKDNYSICQFTSGKVYNCDLNASYNIGARYFIREILKSDPVMGRLPDETKASHYGTGTTRTLSTLIRLNADLQTERVCGF